MFAAAILAAAVLAAGAPPAAYIEPGHVQMALDGWCWGQRCGAPIAPSTRAVVLERGAQIRIDLGFVPRTVRLAVGGRATVVLRRGRELFFRPGRTGGVTLNVAGARGWVIYVGRVVVR